jgi:hypothetical protein
MLSRRNWGRLLATGLLSLTGAIGLRQILPWLRIDSSLCVHPAAGLGEIGLRLHVFSAAASCPRGSYLPGENLGAVVQFSFAVSVLALVVGSVLALGALGVGWWAAAVLGRLRDWLRRRLSVRFVPRLSRPERALVAVVVPVRVARTTPSPLSRRGPPAGC